jgi:endonuclease/exonuclease/phosphatase (EEP) superfamily protein YafD
MGAGKKGNRFFSPRIRPWDLVIACGAIFAAATIVGFFGRFWWFLDLFSHFRVQLFLGLSIMALLMLVRRNYAATALFGTFGAINLCTIAPLFVGKLPGPTVVSRPYKALLLNVNSDTGDPLKVNSLIAQEQPDIVALEEINERWLTALSVTLTNYPYSKVEPRDDNFGIGLFCKYPFRKCEARQIGEAEVPSILAETELGGTPLTVIATHPLPPGGAENSRLRNDQLAELSAILKQSASPILLLGDLNATPWCTSFKQLLSESGLHEASQGRGVLPTWPTYLPIFLIPIDHCLHSSGIHVSRLATGPKVGSDHYPLLVDFVLTKPTGN